MSLDSRPLVARRWWQLYLFVVVLVAARPAWSITLDVLGEALPGTTTIEVTLGDPVVVTFEVGAEERASEHDLIQLRSLDTEDVVDQQVRGEALTGTVVLDTADSPLGELDVVYVYEASGAVLATAEETVRVVEVAVAPTEVEVGSDEAPTIQAAVDLVADGGTVYIGAGRYEEEVTIVGKEVHLVGAGAFGWRRTELRGSTSADVVAPGVAVGLVNYGPGGGGSIEDMAFRGGQAAIVGYAEDDELPAPLSAKDIFVYQGAQGVIGTFGDLSVSDAYLFGLTGSGILLVSVSSAELHNGLIWDTDDVAMLIYNFAEGPGRIEIIGETVGLSSQAGIVVVGDAKPVLIQDTGVGGCNLAGILLIEAGQVDIIDSTVLFIGLASGPNYQNVGDGVLAVSSSDVHVTGGWFEYIDRSAVLFDDSAGTLQDSIAIGVRYGVVSQGSPDFDYGDPGNVIVGGEENIETDGALPVPEAPPLPGEP